MVFNIYVTNDDNHHAQSWFYLGSQLPGWRLNLLYDVLPWPSHGTERLLHLEIGSQRALRNDRQRPGRLPAVLDQHRAPQS